MLVCCSRRFACRESCYVNRQVSTEHNPGRRNHKRLNEVVKDMRGRDPRKGNLKTADNFALYPLTVKRAVPLRLNKKVKNSAKSGM